MKDANGNIIEVPKSVGKKTGIASKEMQAAMPDAVLGPDKGGVIIDDKPFGRDVLSKDYQEMRRNIEAYTKKYGVEPQKTVIEWYDPATGRIRGLQLIIHQTSKEWGYNNV